MRTFKVLSMLLMYPDEEIVAGLDDMAAILDQEALLPPAARKGLDVLMRHLATSDLMDSQAAYVSLFDQSRSLSLHLFEHIHGDSRERGQAMADLIDHYRSFGMEVSAAELPDFLPLFLEFLSTQPLHEALSMLGEAVNILALLRSRLEKRGAPYAPVFRALEALSPVGADEEAIQEQVKGEKRDDTSAALDKSWEDAPVTFGPEPARGHTGDGTRAQYSVPVESVRVMRRSRP